MRRQRGQASLEMLIIILLWLSICALFLSGMLVIGSLMLTQSGVSRTTQQIATLGCVPGYVSEKNISLTGIGVGPIETVEVEQRLGGSQSADWEPVPECPQGPDGSDAPDKTVDPAGSGQLIRTNITYEQQLIFPFGAKWMVPRSATAISGRLER